MESAGVRVPAKDSPIELSPLVALEPDDLKPVFTAEGAESAEKKQ
jgi:hypothetical protein